MLNALSDLLAAVERKKKTHATTMNNKKQTIRTPSMNFDGKTVFLFAENKDEQKQKRETPIIETIANGHINNMFISDDTD